MVSNILQELQDAYEEYSGTPTPTTFTRLVAVIEEYMQLLRPQVGEQLVAKYDHAYTALRVTARREEAFQARLLSVGGASDDGDIQFLRALRDDTIRAMENGAERCSGGGCSAADLCSRRCEPGRGPGRLPRRRWAGLPRSRAPLGATRPVCARRDDVDSRRSGTLRLLGVPEQQQLRAGADRADDKKWSHAESFVLDWSCVQRNSRVPTRQ